MAEVNTSYLFITTLSWVAFTTLFIKLFKEKTYRKGEKEGEDIFFATIFGLFGAIFWPFTWIALTVTYTANETHKKLEEEGYL